MYGFGHARILVQDLLQLPNMKFESREPKDLASALMGLLGENIALLCGQLAKAMHAEGVIYCGSTLERNTALAGVLKLVTRAFGVSASIPGNGAYCGAIGAASLASAG